MEKFDALAKWQENRQGLIKKESNVSDMTVPAPPIPMINQFNEVSNANTPANQTQGAPFIPNNAGIDDEAIVINSPGRRRSVRAPNQNVDGGPSEEEDEFL